jgi:hypothetical protein
VDAFRTDTARPRSIDVLKVADAKDSGFLHGLGQFHGSISIVERLIAQYAVDYTKGLEKKAALPMGRAALMRSGEGLSFYATNS